MLGMELAQGIQAPVGCSPSTGHNLLAVRDLWVQWPSRGSSEASVANHRGLSEPKSAPQAEMAAPHVPELNSATEAVLNLKQLASRKASYWNSSLLLKVRSKHPFFSNYPLKSSFFIFHFLHFAGF